ncbi:MAG TPA: methionine adenosyltransferase [Burkholderiales bacterium]|nr:methionine adenosyltransferase [Burkholderiales bacterium]
MGPAHLAITLLDAPAPGSAANEVVERKGRGHPDTVCDALAENLSIGLSRFYLERFGTVLHHNVDKALLLGGAARPAFGGGELLEPIEIILAGRATRRFGGVTVPVEELAVELSREWLRRNLRHIDPERHIRIVPRLRETSSDLAELFARGGESGVPRANDTSIGVGFAPLDRLERAVLVVERSLTAPDTLAAAPEIGEDVKVMGVRSGERIELTVACALVGRHVRDLGDYFAKKAYVRSLAAAAATAAAPGEVAVEVNTADGESADNIYLTVTGLSAEAGDDGQVGRGNRVNGLITPYRPMSLEAAAGKNAVSHTGKIYNLLAERIARALTADIPGVAEAYVRLLSRIGASITEPALADIGLRLADPAALDALRPRAAQLVRANLDEAPQLWRDVIAGRLPVC